MEESKFDELSEVLQYHCNKKNAVNTMGESNIPMHAFIFRCGWETNSIHTIFSYLFTSLSNDIRCGKMLANWLFKKLNEIYGGTTPSIDDINTETELVNCFSCNLFVHRTHIMHKTKFKRILAANVLRFLKEPMGKRLSTSHVVR